MGKGFKDDNQGFFTLNKMLAGAGLILVLCGLFIIPFCTEKILAGHEGILIEQYGSNKGVQVPTIVTGRIWFNPFSQDIVQYATHVKTIDYDPFVISASDGAQFTVDPTLSFNVNPGKSPHIWTKYYRELPSLATTIVLNHVKEAFRIQLNEFTSDSLVSNRASFERAVEKSLIELLGRDGMSVEQLSSGLGYPPSMLIAIDAKNKAVQEAMQVENELRVAEAQARKLLVAAEAESKANKLKTSALNDLIIKQQFIEKWDGKSPLYSSSPSFFKSLD